MPPPLRTPRDPTLPDRYSSQFQDNYFTELCSRGFQVNLSKLFPLGSKAGVVGPVAAGGGRHARAHARNASAQFAAPSDKSTPNTVGLIHSLGALSPSGRPERQAQPTLTMRPNRPISDLRFTLTDSPGELPTT